MSDNPFTEPEDNDRTVFRPMPGGQRGAARGTPPAAPSPPAPRGAPPRPPARAEAATPITRSRRTAAGPARRRPGRTRACLHQSACRCRSTAAAVAGPAAQHRHRARPGRHAGPHRPGDARLREACPRGRRQHGAGPPRPLRPVRQPGRRGVEHALGLQRALEPAHACGHFPQRPGRRRRLLRPIAADAHRTGCPPARTRAHVHVPLARLHGPLPHQTRRAGAGRAHPRTSIRPDHRQAAGGPAGAVPALGGGGGAIPPEKDALSSLGGVLRRHRCGRWPVHLDPERPQHQLG